MWAYRTNLGYLQQRRQFNSRDPEVTTAGPKVKPGFVPLTAKSTRGTPTRLLGHVQLAWTYIVSALVTSNSVENSRAGAQTYRTHSSDDDMDIDFILNLPPPPLKAKAPRIHLLGLVQISCEYIIPTSVTSNNVGK